MWQSKKHQLQKTKHLLEKRKVMGTKTRRAIVVRKPKNLIAKSTQTLKCNFQLA